MSCEESYQTFECIRSSTSISFVWAERRFLRDTPSLSRSFEQGVGVDGTDLMEEIVRENYYRVKADVAELVLREIARIEADPKLSALLPKKK